MTGPADRSGGLGGLLGGVEWDEAPNRSLLSAVRVSVSEAARGKACHAGV